ncbi:MAG: ferritin [bacterium]|nr:ferritin [bacterium]
MISERMAEKLNYHINRELYSSYFYQAMSAYSTHIGLNGFANWFNVQVQEELNHAQKVYTYIQQQGEKIEFFSVEAPENDFSSPKNLFEETLEHERFVTGLVYDLVKLAKEESDFATDNFLQWFIKEQVEEEATASEILQKMNLIGDDKQSLLMLDQELAKRVFVNTALVE